MPEKNNKAALYNILTAGILDTVNITNNSIHNTKIIAFSASES